MRWSEHVARMEAEKNSYINVAGKYEWINEWMNERKKKQIKKKEWTQPLVLITTSYQNCWNFVTVKLRSDNRHCGPVREYLAQSFTETRLEMYMSHGEPGSSVSTVSSYGMDDREIEVRFPTEARGFFPLGPPSLLYNVYGGGGSFPGGKERPGRNADHSPHLLPRSRMSRSYTSSPPCSSIGV
jgi:hypothetical protein